MNFEPPKDPVYNITIGDNEKVLTNVRFDGCQYHMKGRQMDGVNLRQDQRRIHFVDVEDPTVQFDKLYCMILCVEYNEETDTTSFNIYERTYAEMEDLKIKSRITWIELQFPRGELANIETMRTSPTQDMYFKQIQNFFNTGIWGYGHVKLAVQKGLLTPQMYEEITGEHYE